MVIRAARAIGRTVATLKRCTLPPQLGRIAYSDKRASTGINLMQIFKSSRPNSTGREAPRTWPTSLPGRRGSCGSQEDQSVEGQEGQSCPRAVFRDHPAQVGQGEVLPQ